MTHGEAELTLVLSDRDETEVLEVQGRVDLEANDIQNPLDGRDAVLEVLDLVLAEHFASRREWRPSLDWKEHPQVDGPTIWVRGSMRNMAVERMADEFLAAHPEVDT